jgi:hypothetical protein
MKPVSGGGNDDEAQKASLSTLAPEHLVDFLVLDRVKFAAVKKLALLPRDGVILSYALGCKATFGIETAWITILSRQTEHGVFTATAD